MITKKCKTCQVIKTTLEFYSHKQTRDKLDTICKPCKKEAAVAWARKNPERNRDKTKAYNQRHPERRKETNRKYYESNKQIVKDRINAWVEKNPDKIREYGRIHANRRRARKLENGTEPYTEKQVLELYGKLCHICESKINLSAPRKVGTKGWEKGLHIDHIVPISKGGSDTLDNVRPTHALCNLKKSDLL